MERIENELQRLQKILSETKIKYNNSNGDIDKAYYDGKASGLMEAIKTLIELDRNIRHDIQRLLK